MTRQFNGVWYVSKQITRKGKTYGQWFRCKAPEGATIKYLGVEILCDAQQEAAMADVRRERAGAAAAILAAPAVAVKRLGNNVISVEDAEAQALQYYAKQQAEREMAKLIAYTDPLGAELARLENEGGPCPSHGNVPGVSCSLCKTGSFASPDDVVYVITPEQLLAAATPETRAKVVSLAEHRQRVYNDAMNH